MRHPSPTCLKIGRLAAVVQRMRPKQVVIAATKEIMTVKISAA